MYAKGDFDGALKKIELSLQQDATDMTAWIMKGIVLEKLKRPSEALTWWTKLADRFPAEPPALIRLSGAQMRAGQYEKALETLNKVIDIEPTDGARYWERGQCYFVMGRYQEAYSELQSAQKVGFSDPSMNLQTIWLKRVLRQFEGTNLPPRTWRPDYTQYHSKFSNVEGDDMLVTVMVDKWEDMPKPKPGEAVPAGGAPGTKMSFKGSEQKPLTFAPGFYVWEGAWINDPQYGLLLENGTHFKHVVMKSQKRIVNFGKVSDWVFRVERTLTEDARSK